MIRYTTQRLKASFPTLLHSTSTPKVLVTEGRSDGSWTEKSQMKDSYDAVIIGGGHNGLGASFYLAKAGYSVCVLERRGVIGGAAVTEEIIPGFKFSRASYLLSLLRPQIYEDLQLKKHGLEIYIRDPSSYTPIRDSKSSLTLYMDKERTRQEINKFSAKDAECYDKYESWLLRMSASIEPLLDSAPPDLPQLLQGSLLQRIRAVKQIMPLINTGKLLGVDAPQFYQLLTAPMSKILDYWFESDVLKATLATDSVIGAMMSPHTPGSGYVLLHHVMGGVEGHPGCWGYPRGGMGAVSSSIARAAISAGVHIFTDSPVARISMSHSDVAAGGVELAAGGEVVRGRVVLSNATPHLTYLTLTPDGALPSDFLQRVRGIDYTSPVTKINVALNAAPRFSGSEEGGGGQEQLQATIHINCESMQILDDAYHQCREGRMPDKPMIELVLPSTLDDSLAPPGCHVASMFTQYTPYSLRGHQRWTDELRDQYANIVFSSIEDYAPGFSNSIVGYEVLTPQDLEEVFGLTGGNIFHGAMSIDQLYLCRPTPDQAGAGPSYGSPLPGLYLCGSGAHPGGGVMGAPGRLSAIEAINYLKRTPRPSP